MNGNIVAYSVFWFNYFIYSTNDLKYLTSQAEKIACSPWAAGWKALPYKHTLF